MSSTSSNPKTKHLGYATTPWLIIPCRLKNTHTRPLTKPPRRFCPNRPGAQGLHPLVRSRAPAVKTKIPQTILPESPRGSGAPVGFINPGSLTDRLPNNGSAQTDNAQLMGWPRYLNNRIEGQSNHRPKSLTEEERRSFSDSGPPLRPERSLRSPARLRTAFPTRRTS